MMDGELNLLLSSTYICGAGAANKKQNKNKRRQK